ncbi:hypothetical protein AQ916_07040 [Burkholderia pseudomallei]|uniref:hypothetical protein n=1 Tax=Burkholderia pseudomallei TaxID=28450 RepID=UPI00050E07D7|nr:hypothetical protein [Burkholderia pseudomallei]KGC50988.1 hypothetical protein DO66_5834 [Burkholderia pseudomallei]KGW26993.1 hypothetical protein Y602_1967 [Burkholderia pseudomallei MSHR733]OMZ07261.1 hypothetical protein AQ858_22545 [Burkholderia pseudomallei]OMZ13151.1 hypothetical protein AQ857_03625 [Burkholderia pseudomallei]ONC38501.1 hypothetical protein AQ916_07040 [Burkholderia pseudomallei]
MKPSTATERALARRVDELKLTRDVYPIADPRLAEVSELLHRICAATTLDAARWMAGDALVQLRAYVQRDGAQQA